MAEVAEGEAARLVLGGGDAVALSGFDGPAGVQKRLQMFILRAKARLSDASDTQVALGLAGAMAKLVTIGDSLTQGFSSFAISRTDQSYPALLARAHPPQVPGGDLPRHHLLPGRAAERQDPRRLGLQPPGEGDPRRPGDGGVLAWEQEPAVARHPRDAADEGEHAGGAGERGTDRQ